LTADLVSLAIISLVSVVCPIIANIIPRKPIPEIVLLVLCGAIIGPNTLGLVQVTDSISMLSDLGMGFLFLLAGYEINPKSLFGRQGRRGIVTWFVTFAIALGLNFLVPYIENDMMTLAASSLLLTTTALGTLLPILKDRGLMDTKVGESVLAYGTWGELAPVLAMAILLSARATWITALILAAFLLLCILVATTASRAKNRGGKIANLIMERADSTSQTVMRIVVCLLIVLLAVSAVFDLDLVLGAFAAGFILRYVTPETNEIFNKKLDGIAYGFFIPLFFVVSGTAIDFSAVAKLPILLIIFIIALIAVRAVPVFVSMSTDKETKSMSPSSRLSVAFYCTTALPLIVAITSLSVNNGIMNSDIASVLVAAGAVTVFLMPLLAAVCQKVADVKPIEAVKEISKSPRDAKTVLQDHIALERMLEGKDSPEDIEEAIPEPALDEIAPAPEAPPVATASEAAPEHRRGANWEELNENAMAVRDAILRRREALAKMYAEEMRKRREDLEHRHDLRMAHQKNQTHSGKQSEEDSVFSPLSPLFGKSFESKPQFRSFRTLEKKPTSSDNPSEVGSNDDESDDATSTGGSDSED
jgi:Kef-type K+ transport system membrane component KefB